VVVYEKEACAKEMSPKLARLSNENPKVEALSPTTNSIVANRSQNSCASSTPTDRILRSDRRQLELVQGLELKQGLQLGLEKEIICVTIGDDDPEFAGRRHYKSSPNSIRTYGYSSGDATLCLELSESKTLPNLLAKQFDQAESEDDIEEIIRDNGNFKLWQRVDSTAIVSCLGDGKYCSIS